MADEGFFSRWSRLKSGQPPAGDSGTSPRPAGDCPSGTVPRFSGEHPQPPAPTLEDATRLGPDSDYSAFVSRDVDASVRRLALRKLFADPHFNVRDGLDVYMGDYTRADPIPAAMLASLGHASAWLGLAQDDEPQQQSSAPQPAVQDDGQQGATTSQQDQQERAAPPGAADNA